MNTKPRVNILVLVASIAIVLAAVWYIGLSYKNASVAGSKSPTSTATIAGESSKMPILKIATSGPAFLGELAADAVPTSSIDVSGCTPHPLVASFALGSQVEFKNSDTKPVNVDIGSKSFKVPSSSSLTIDMSLWNKPGGFSYSCDSNQYAGFLYVTPKGK